MSILTLVSGQTVQDTRTALDSRGQTITGFSASTGDFHFVDDQSNVWSFTMGSWSGGSALFTLTAPTVTARQTLTLTREYLGSPFPASPPVLQFDVVPVYKGNFNLTGADLAWDGTIYTPGTDDAMFDYALNGHTGTALNGVTPFPDAWFTAGTQYRTSHGGSLTTLGRRLYSFTDDQTITSLNLLTAAGLHAFSRQDTTTNWAVTIIGVFIRKVAHDASGPADNLMIFGWTDPTHLAGQVMQTLVPYIPSTAVIEAYTPGDSGWNLPIPISDSNHYWDDALQAVCVAMVFSWSSGSSQLTETIFANGTQIATHTGAFVNNAGSGYTERVAAMDAISGGTSTTGFAVADFAIFPSALSQPQIAAQAAAWGL